jgi:hypothetical protein
MKTVTLVDPQGKDVLVPQEQVVPLLRSGFGARTGQTVTLDDEKATQVPIERIAEALGKGIVPKLETQRAGFERGAEERFGGGAGLAAGLGYGALQGATLGLGGKALMETGLVAPETLAQLEQARGGGMLSTIGAGEMLGLGAASALTGGAAAGEAAAARTLGQATLRSAGREALIGGAYGAGSEITQAGIERREARPLEAGAMGAAFGGTLGAAIPALSKAASKAMGKAAAAEGATLAGEAVPGATDAAERMTLKRQELADQARTKADEITDIANAYNDVLDRTQKAGFKTPEAGIGRIGKDLRRISDTLAKKEAEALSLAEQELLQKDLDRTLASGLKSKGKIASQRTILETTLNDLQAEFDALGEEGRSSLRASALGERIKRTQGELEFLGNVNKTLEDFAARGADLQGLALTEAAQLRAEGATARRVANLRAKLEGTGEKAVELGGESGANARAQRAAAERQANVMTQGEVELNQALADYGIASKAKNKYMILRAIENAEAEPETFRSFVRDLVTMERGFKTEPTARGGKRNASIFAETFKLPQVLDRLSPENGAYVRAIAEVAQSVDLLRSAARGGKAIRIPGIAADLEAVEGLVGAERYKQIRMDAARDMMLPEIQGAKAADAAVLAEKYRYVPKGAATAETAPVAAEAAVENVNASNVAGRTPGETIKLRESLTRAETTLKEIQEQLDATRAKKKEIAEKRIELSKTLREARGNERVRRLDERERALAEQYVDATTLESSLRENKQGITDLRNQVRTNRMISAEELLEQREREVAAKQAMADAKRWSKAVGLKGEIEGLSKELSEKTKLKTELELLRDEHVGVGARLDELTKLGDRNLLKAGAQQGRIVPVSEQQIFDRSMKAFLASPEGKELSRELAKQSKSFAQKMLEPDNLLAALSAGTTGMGVMGGSLPTMLIGIGMAAMGGKKGLYKAAATFMNPVRAWTAAGNAIGALERLTPRVSRTAATTSSYTFPVKEANDFVDSILADREAAENAFRKMAQSGTIEAKNLQAAKNRFDAAVDYLERKRPMTKNGADAQDFARAVAVVRNPDLLAKFIKEGTLRQQDVDVLQRISPESYASLKGAVELLHQQRPAAVANLAPLFKIMTKSKSLMRTTIPIALLQQMSGASMPAQQGMTPKSETAAARGRAASAADAPTAKNVSNDTSLTY